MLFCGPLQDPIEVGSQTPILPPAVLLGDQPLLTQLIQGPLDGGAGEMQLGGNGPNPRPALALPIRMVLQVHIDRPRPVTQT